MKNKQSIKEVKHFQKIAGILKEFIESDPETITQAFQQAGIDLDKPVVYICDYGNPGGTDKPKKELGGKLLRELEAERAKEEEENPNFNEWEGITYEINPTQGEGELLGDYTPEAVKGLKCKLNVYFSDSHLYEIWQAGSVNEEHPDDPSSADIDDIEDQDPEDFDDISEEELNEADSFKFKQGDVVNSKVSKGNKLVILMAFPNLEAAYKYDGEDGPTSWERAILNNEIEPVSKDVANKPWYLTWTRETVGEDLITCDPEEFLSK